MFKEDTLIIPRFNVLVVDDIDAKQKEMLFHIQKRSVEEITDLKREIESLKNRVYDGYPRFNR